ncbi:MAG: branched-chain amino acid transport system II carrier protein [Bulleidia sp.]
MKLNFRQRLLIAMTLFGMFFGAGNLIFPVHLGQLAGSNAIPAMIGFIVTAVTIPILAVGAIGITHSDGLQKLASNVNPRYGIFFTCLLYLTIGPLFAIPRCATVSYTTGVEPLFNSPYGLLVFSFVFFALVLYFSLKPGNITLYIGRIINPVFLIFYAILLISALLHPGASIASVTPDPSYVSGSLFNGLIEGYGTMDAIAGLAFGIVVIDIIRSMGIHDETRIAKEVGYAGILAGGLMALIYVLSIIMGAQSRGLFEISENGGIALAQIASHYLGNAGALILAFTITFACLKTSIGLVTSCSDTFERMTDGKISYRTWAILFTLFSFIISNIGLSGIIQWSIPVLMLIYPPAIALVFLAFAGRLFAHDGRVYQMTMIFVWIAACFDFLRALPVTLTDFLARTVNTVTAVLPFSDISLGWVVPAMIGFVIGLAVHFNALNHHD